VIGAEVAVYLLRSGGTANAPPTALPQSVSVKSGGSVAITLTYNDPDGPGPAPTPSPSPSSLAFWIVEANVFSASRASQG
jgi:hypothetical protein